MTKNKKPKAKKPAQKTPYLDWLFQQGPDYQLPVKLSHKLSHDGANVLLHTTYKTVGRKDLMGEVTVTTPILQREVVAGAPPKRTQKFGG